MTKARERKKEKCSYIFKQMIKRGINGKGKADQLNSPYLFFKSLWLQQSTVDEE